MNILVITTNCFTPHSSGKLFSNVIKIHELLLGLLYVLCFSHFLQDQKINIKGLFFVRKYRKNKKQTVQRSKKLTNYLTSGTKCEQHPSLFSGQL